MGMDAAGYYKNKGKSDPYILYLLFYNQLLIGGMLKERVKKVLLFKFK